MDTAASSPVRVLYLTPECDEPHVTGVVAALRNHGLSVECFYDPDAVYAHLREDRASGEGGKCYVLGLNPHALPPFPANWYVIGEFIWECRKLALPAPLRCLLVWPGDVYLDPDGMTPWANHPAGPQVDMHLNHGERSREEAKFFRRLAQDLERGRDGEPSTPTAPAGP